MIRFLYLVPVQRGRIVFPFGVIIRAGQTDALTIVPLVVASVAVPPVAIASFEEICALFSIVTLHEVSVNLQLALRNVGTTGNHAVDLVLCDKLGDNYKFIQYIIDDEDDTQIRKFECEYRATRRKELTSLFFAHGCCEVIWKMPEETGFYQPIMIAKKQGCFTRITD